MSELGTPAVTFNDNTTFNINTPCVSRPTSASNGSDSQSCDTGSRPSSASSTFSTPRSDPHHKKRTKFEIFLHFVRVAPRRALCSISFIVLLLATCAAVIPAIIIWTASVSGGLSRLQESLLQECMERRAGDVKLSLELSLGACEDQLLGFSEYLTASVANRYEDEPDFDLIFNKSMAAITMLTKHHGCGRTLVIAVNDGGYALVEITWIGSVLAIQRGFPPENVSFVCYLFDLKNFAPEWEYPFVYPGAYAVGKYAGVSDTILQELLDGSSLVWTPFATQYSSGAYSSVMSSNMIAPIKDSTGTFLRGIVEIMISDNAFEFLFANTTAGPGINCVFVQDTNGCLLASSCENATKNDFTENVTRVCTNSSIWPEVRESAVVLTDNLGGGALLSNNDTAVIVKGAYAYAYTRVKTTYGFEAISTVVAGMKYRYINLTRE